jgi:hypothetical protein
MRTVLFVELVSLREMDPMLVLVLPQLLLGITRMNLSTTSKLRMAGKRTLRHALH